MGKEKQVYTVKVKDYRENATHTLHEWATSQNKANSIALQWLRDAFGHDEFELL